MKFYPLFVNKSIMLRYIHKLNSGNLFLTCLFVFLFFSLSLIINIAFTPKETKLSRYSTIIQKNNVCCPWISWNHGATRGDKISVQWGHSLKLHARGRASGYVSILYQTMDDPAVLFGTPVYTVCTATIS